MVNSNLFFKIFKPLLVVVTFLFFLFPILWTFMSAFKTRTDLFSFPPKFIFAPNMGNFFELMAPERRFLQCLTNTFIIASATTLIAVFAGALMAYSIARFRFRGRMLLSIQAIILTTIPPIVLVVPLFTIFQEMGLIDTLAGLILADCSFTIPFAVWVLRGFFEELPIEVEEAAMIDGCTRFNSFLKITLPLAAPGLVAAGIIIFLAVWNEFLFAVIFSRVNAKTLTVFMSGFVTPVDTSWEYIFSSQVVAELPVMILTLMIYKYLVRGLTFGAVKG